MEFDGMESRTTQSLFFDDASRGSARQRNRALELIVDNFAGGGGASLGIERAIGRAVDLAINHSPDAMALHAINHPATRHIQDDLFGVDPVEVTRGQPVGLAWFSPDCKHFSRAKGSKPVEKKIRGLAWVTIKWARTVHPRIIVLENVREFQDWGPLGPDKRPCKARKGRTFKLFLGRLKAAGYAVEFRVLNAADFGAPTHRRRLFLIARRDGLPIQWPEPTHGPGRRKKWRAAAECIDWSIPCPSIFDRKKPLAEKTLRRIAHGIKRYVLDAAKPFIVRVEHGKDEFRGQSLDKPLGTVTSKNGYGLVSPTLVQTGYSERDGQSPRALNIGKPLGTVVSGGKHALVAAFLAQNNTMPRNGIHAGHAADAPVSTVTASGAQQSLAVANLIRMNHGDKQWADVADPLGTITSQGNKFAVVYSFLVKYFGCGIGQTIDNPLHTVTTKDRFGVVTVDVDGQTYAIVDIGLRMLSPRELARAQGFPADYILPDVKSKAVAAIGNSVCPDVAAAIVKANYSDDSQRATKQRPIRPDNRPDVGMLFGGAWA